MVRLNTLGRLQLLRDGPPTEPIHLQPKRLALLAYLALAPGDGSQQRDTLLALFWPHSDRECARRCLRQSLFHLRNELGDGVLLNRGRDGIALAPDRLWCDAVEVERALQGRRRREALDLYAGDFLPGLFVEEGGAELEEWIERTRRHLRARVVAGAWDLIEEEERQRRTTSALELARLARRLSPDDEPGLRRHMSLLARAGDPASALRAYAEFSRRLRRDYEAEPSPESRALADSLKQGRLLSEPTYVGTDCPDAAQVAARSHTGRRRSTDSWSRARRLAPVAMALVAGFALAGPLTRAPSGPIEGRPVLVELGNRTRDSLLAVAVTEAVRAELSKVAPVDLAGMRAVGPTDAARPGQAGKVLIVVTGDISALGHGFTVSARLLPADSGRLLGVNQEDTADTEFLSAPLTRPSQRVRGDVLESLVPHLDGRSPRRRLAGWLAAHVGSNEGLPLEPPR